MEALTRHPDWPEFQASFEPPIDRPAGWTDEACALHSFGLLLDDLERSARMSTADRAPPPPRNKRHALAAARLNNRLEAGGGVLRTVMGQQPSARKPR